MKLTGFVPAIADQKTARDLRFAVEEFNSEYCAVLDAGEVELWPDFFTEDALYRITAKENADEGLPIGLVYAEGKNMLRDRAAAIARTQMFAPRYNLHLTSNIRITAVGDKGEFEAQTHFILMQTLVEGPGTIHMTGRYYDRFQKIEGRILLSERQVIYDTTIIANDVVYPV